MTEREERDEELISFFNQGKADKISGKYNPPPEKTAASYLDPKFQSELNENRERYDSGYNSL